MKGLVATAVIVCICTGAHAAQEWWKPYSPPCTERENVFAFTEKPSVRLVAKDRYEITFAVKGNCDVTVDLRDGENRVVRHLASGVLGANAPAPFQRDSLKQTIYWNGQDDLGVYVKKPEALTVKVALGLKPVFDKRLGGKSPHNLPGYVYGIAVGPEGAVVFSKRWRIHARRFDLDGEYVMSILPPPAGTPEEKMAGMGYVEYEPGRKAVQGPDLYLTVSDRGWLFNGVDHGGIGDFQPAMYDGRIYFLAYAGLADFQPALMYYVKMDGSTDFNGVRGVPFSFTEQRHPRLAVSPDGKWLYMAGVGGGQFGGQYNSPVVLRRAREGMEPAKPFLGNARMDSAGGVSAKPGADDDSFNGIAGIDCDGKGRIYVCDNTNNRVQIFSPDGKHLKTVPVDRPMLIRVHRTTGAMYVLHTSRVKGVSVSRLTKFASFDNPREEFHQDGIAGALMAIDSWSPRARIWLAGGRLMKGGTGSGGIEGSAESVTIYEDTGRGLTKLIDFDERARTDDGPFYYGRWRNEKGGSGGNTRLDADPLRERAYYHTNLMFDLRTGHFLGWWNAAPHRCIIDDIAFDKRGYMHIHFNPTFYFKGVSRVDTSKPQPYRSPDFDGHGEYYPEVPYDYGIADEGRQGYWKGILPVKDQSGAHGFQFGVGVNMQGDIAVASQIYYVPKMEDSVMTDLNAGMKERQRLFGVNSTGGIRFSEFMRTVQEMEKRGEAVYSIKRRPGVPLSGSTIWTYDRTGELRAECAAIVGREVNGVEIDEEGKLYFLCDKMRAVGDNPPRPFLHGRGGTFGGEPHKGNLYPMTGTILKTRGKDARILKGKAVVPLSPFPDRPPDLFDTAYQSPSYDRNTWAWAEGAEWLYAGVSPFRFRNCKCPSIRFCTDWYKRTFAPEAYRHSLGVLDTNGNLVMHIGEYGNFDSGNGLKSAIPVGKDGIAVFHPRAVATTDNYILFSNWGERVTVLKIEYHAEETAPVRM